METVRRLRAMASLCRQSAALHPDIGWKLLAEAEYWEHLANAVLLEHFSECTASSNELMQLQPTPTRTTRGATRLPPRDVVAPWRGPRSSASPPHACISTSSVPFVHGLT
jgi:hypothetical protein